MEEITGRHEVLASLARAREQVVAGLAAVERLYGMSDADVRDGLEAAFELVSSTQALALALTKELDGRADAVPGAAGDRAARTFLVHRLNLDGGTAKGFVDAAYALDRESGDLASVGQALADGQITFDHARLCVRAVARLPKKLRTCLVTDETTGEQVTGMQLVDRVLAATITDLPPRGVQRLADRLVTLLDPDRKERFDEDAHLRRGLGLSFDATGMGVLRVTMPAVDAAWLKSVLSQLSRPDPQTSCTVVNPDGSTQEEVVRDERSLDARRYDAFMALLRRGTLRFAAAGDVGAGDCTESGVEGGAGDGSQGIRHGGAGAGAQPEVKVIITATAEQVAGLRGAGKATLDRVGPIDAGVLSLFTCSATLRRVLTDPRGIPIDVGRAYRPAPPGLRAALVVRDKGCVVPGCTVPADGCDAHHVVPWSRGGRTDEDNMVLACPRHHQNLHDGTYELEIRDGIVYVRPPAWVDPLRRWRRNALHHSHSRVTRMVEQLALALADEDADERRHGTGGAAA